MAHEAETLELAYGLPEPLRRVLGSRQKLQILCLIEAGVTDSHALADALLGIRRNSINLHLNELQSAGWIRVADLRKRRGTHARIWQTTHPTFSWRTLHAHLTTQTPTPTSP